MSAIHQAKLLGAKVISLSGGEPLLYPYWRDIVECVVDHDMEVLFYSCAIKDTEFWAQDTSYVVKKGIDKDDMEFLLSCFKKARGRIIFSLEGTDALVHDRIVGVKGSFLNTIRAIEEAQAMGLTVELHFTPMELNWHQIPSFLAFARTAKVDKVSFLRLVPQGRTICNPDIMYDASIFDHIQHELYGYEASEPKFRIGCPLSFGHLYGYVEQRPRCHAGLDLMLIRPNGDIHACAGWKECKSLVAGNVQTSTLSTVWHYSPIFVLIRNFHMFDSAAGFCGSCPWKPYCGGGCPAQRIILNQAEQRQQDNWNLLTEGVDPMCPRYNGILSDTEIRDNRKQAGFPVVQDKHGNIVEGGASIGER